METDKLKTKKAELETMLNEEVKKNTTSTQRIIALRGAIEWADHLIKEDETLTTSEEEKS